MIDDNFFGHPEWKRMMDELIATGKKFQFHQGLDERILTDEKAQYLAKSKYDGHFKFAFDNIEDRDVIEKKIKLLRQYSDRNTMFYVFTGFDREDKYTQDFYKQDLLDLMERIKILMSYKCFPYIMRHINYHNSPYRGFYINIARWANQQSMITKKSLQEFIDMHKETSATQRYHKEALSDIPELERYINIHWGDEQ